MSIAQAIRSIRAHLGDNMTAFAERLGIDQGTISRYENAKVQPSRSVLILLLQLAETDEEREPIARALGPGQSKQQEEFLQKMAAFQQTLDNAIAEIEGSDKRKALFLDLVQQTIATGRVPSWLTDSLRLWLHECGTPAEKAFATVPDYISEQLLRHRHPELVPSDAEKVFIARARQFFKSASPELLHEVESVMVMESPGRQVQDVERRRKVR